MTEKRGCGIRRFPDATIYSADVQDIRSVGCARIAWTGPVTGLFVIPSNLSARRTPAPMTSMNGGDDFQLIVLDLSITRCSLTLRSESELRRNRAKCIPHDSFTGSVYRQCIHTGVRVRFGKDLFTEICPVTVAFQSIQPCKDRRPCDAVT